MSYRQAAAAAKETVVCYVKSAMACVAILSAQLFSVARMSLISDARSSDLLFACLLLFSVVVCGRSARERINRVKDTTAKGVAGPL